MYTTRDIERLWSNWPALPEEEVKHYERGQVDGDSYNRADLELLTDLRNRTADSWQVYYATPSVWYRLIGCICYQLALAIEGKEPEHKDLIAALVRFFDGEFTRPRVTSPGRLRGHIPYGYSLSDRFAHVTSDQRLCLRAILEGAMERLDEGLPVIGENEPWTSIGDEDLKRSLPKIVEAIGGLNA